MIHKLYKNKKSIANWLDSMKIHNYLLIPDKKYEFIVSVNDSVDLRVMNLTYIPVKFYMVSGHFYCNRKALTSLFGCPTNVGENFDCSKNQLRSLEGGPLFIGGDYICADNHLLSLQGLPKIIPGNFNATKNKISNFSYCPSLIKGSIFLRDNPYQNCSEIKTFKQLNAIHKIEIEKEILNSNLQTPSVRLLNKNNKSILHKI